MPRNDSDRFPIVDAPATGVFVLGMHRSGTSATARLVNLLGVPIGRRADLKPPSEVNKSGYWESNSLTAFNDHLLRDLGGSWAAPPRLPPGWESAPWISGHRSLGRALFRWVHDSERWVWKDPRNCMTLPFWRRTLGAPSVIVLTHRNPLETARSLPHRYGVGKRLALSIWERYMRTALAASRGLPVFVMPYSGLLTRPRRWTDRLRAFLIERGVELGPRDAGGRAAASIDPGLRHFSLADPALSSDPDLSSPQRELFAAIQQAIGEHETFAGLELPPESEDVEALLAARREQDLHYWSNLVGAGREIRHFAHATARAVE
jgi:hypothetical protein